MRYYIIAGEASGDLHGSNLIRELIKLDSSISIRCWGGDLMKQAGGELVKHYRELAFMGFIEVIANLPAILKNLKWCKEDIEAYKPDALILIDYPGFNLRIAKWAKEKGFPTIYYISPQVWAWKEGRVKSIRKVVDKMLVILPFEKAFYKKWNFDVEYIGHPLVQVVDEASKEFFANPPAAGSPLNEKNIVAILPGSRKQEIAKKLPVMLEVSRKFPEYRFIVAKSSSIDDEFYDSFFVKYKTVRSIRNKTYPLLIQSKAALVTSGTATLETALFGVPQIVCYKGSAVSYQIARRLIKVKFISLVNLIMNREVVKELIQNEFTVENAARELNRILKDPESVSSMKKDYEELLQILKIGGNASEKAARSIQKFVVSVTTAKTASPPG